jgi:hypothetical protein
MPPRTDIVARRLSIASLCILVEFSAFLETAFGSRSRWALMQIAR